MALASSGERGDPMSPPPRCMRRWKRELQVLADELGIAVTAHHFPPGIRKWNKIGHRRFSFVSQNWRAKLLIRYQVIVGLIGVTTTTAGPPVRCHLDPNAYPKGTRVADHEMQSLNIHRDEFHGDRNYAIRPRRGPDRAVVVS